MAEEVEKKLSAEFFIYLSAWLDLLGQADLLKDLPLFPTPEQHEKFGKPFKNLIAFRRGVIRTHNRLTEPYSPVIPKDFILNQENVHAINKVRSTVIEVEFIGDSALLNIPFQEREDHTPLKSIASLFDQISLQMIIGMAEGLPMRGGIEIGHCFRPSEMMGNTSLGSDLYGQSTAGAYLLESKIAGHPRIILGENFIEYLNKAKAGLSGPQLPPLEKIEKKFLDTITGFIERDYDGLYILDYISNFMDIGKSPETRSTADNALKASVNFIDHEIDKFEKRKDHKLFSRYSLVRSYFKRHGF